MVSLDLDVGFGKRGVQRSEPPATSRWQGRELVAYGLEHDAECIDGWMIFDGLTATVAVRTSHPQRARDR